MIRRNSRDVITAIGNSWLGTLRAAINEESDYRALQEWDLLYGTGRPEFYSYLTKEDFTWLKPHFDLCRQ